MNDLISRKSLKQSIVTSMILGDKKTLDQIIDEEPSIDAVPVRHGHWIVKLKNFLSICSECGAHWDVTITENRFVNYCPKCGAKMDGERKEE